jgi:hypothetical protein
MRRRLVLIALLLPLAVPAAAHAREGRCPDRPGYRVLERHGDTVVTVRGGTYRACLRSVGRDPVILVESRGEGDWELLARIVHGGRFVAAFTEHGTRYGDVGYAVSLHDLASGRRLASPYATGGSVSTAPWHLLEAVVGPHGHVAWTEGVEGREQLRLAVGGDVLLLTAPGPGVRQRVAGLRFEGDVLHWTVDGLPRAHRLRQVDTAPPARPLRCDAPSDYVLQRSGARVLAFADLGLRRDPFLVCLRTSARPFPVDGLPLLDRGERAVVVDARAGGRWRVWTLDVRRRRRAGTVAAFTAAGRLDDAVRDGRRVALSIGRRIVLVDRGRAQVVAEGAAAMLALRLDQSSIAWIEDGVPRSAPLPAG